MLSTSHSKNISLVQWFLIGRCSLLRQSRRPGAEHISCQKYFTGSNGFSSTAVRYCGYPGGGVGTTSRAKNISLVQWFLIDPCSPLHQSRRPGDKHFSCHNYFTGPMVSHRVEDQTSSEATSIPPWKWKGWAEALHALLEQKTLFAHFTPNCGAQMVPALKGVSQAQSSRVGRKRFSPFVAMYSSRFPNCARTESYRSRTQELRGARARAPSRPAAFIDKNRTAPRGSSCRSLTLGRRNAL